eukprot:GGOE01003920.1.p1 GENE.GGOE01003920.1~~GGOE01003920.1.p1  ORF type:complete len:821 (-),score=152.37 GGOE01003920.1:294-2756(-)
MLNSNARWAKAVHVDVENTTVPSSFLCKLISSQELCGDGLFLATKEFLCFRLSDPNGEGAHGGLNIPWKSILLINKTSHKEIDVVTKDGTFTFYGVVDVQQRIKELQASWVEALNSSEEDRSNALSHEDLDRVLSEFRTLNISKKGWLTKAEMLRVLNPVFQYNPLPHSIASAFDRSGDGTVQLGEFLHTIRALKVGTMEEKLEYCFKVFDEDRDGAISMKEFEYVVQHLALLSQFHLPPEEAGMPTFCTKLFHNLQPVDGVVPFSSFTQHFLAVADGVPGAEVLLPIQHCFTAGGAPGRRGVPLSLGDALWPLITLILVGLQRAGDMRRKTEASWAALAQTRTNSESNLFGSLIMNVMTPVGNVLASAVQSTGLDHLGEAIGEDFHSVWTPFQANVLAPIKRDIASPFQGLQTKSWRNTFTFPGCEDPETGKRQEVQFTEFNGKAFWDIRDQYGMNEDEYQKSLGLHELITGLVFGGLNSPRRLSSSGKSASFFFMTHDGQIIMKTLPRKEAQTLCQMLVKYREYILSQGDTLLTVYLGLYEICIGEQKTLFVTMLNVFPPNTHVKVQYDLKGSTAGRSVPEHSRIHNVALKDLDFHQQKTFLVMDSEWQQSLYEQIVRDAEYLQSEGLNDYSLLLGIASGCRGPLSSQSSTDIINVASGAASTGCKASRKFYHGIPDADNTETYYVGIIDILTAFEGVKVVEHAMKSVYQKNFSCIPPNNYAKRFVAFMEAILCSRTVEKLYFVTTGEWAAFERISTVLGSAPPTVSVLDPRLASPLRIPGSPTSHPAPIIGDQGEEDDWLPVDGDEKGKGRTPPPES